MRSMGASSYGTILVPIQAKPQHRSNEIPAHGVLCRSAHSSNLSFGNNNEDRSEGDFVILRAPNREARPCSCAQAHAASPFPKTRRQSLMNSTELESIARGMGAQ